MKQFLRNILSLMIVGQILTLPTFAADWPMWGGDSSRNMVSPQKGLPDEFTPGKYKSGSEEIDLSTTRNVKWVAKLGSQSYGNATISGGKIFVGTNNESPRDPRHIGDRGVVMCLDEKTGEFLWQLVVPKLGAGKVSDWEYLGICSSPLVDGDRVYVVTNRCEVVCLDVHGMSNGNDGPFLDEGQYMVGEAGKAPMEVGPTDADIIWRFDMREEVGVFPHNITSSSVLIVGNRLYVTTSNGQDWSHVYIPAPEAPCLIALDKHTGKLVGEEGSGISARLYHCNWSSPAYGKIGNREMIIFGAGDGFCYGFNPQTVENERGFQVFPEIWRYDCNPPEYKIKDGKPIKYPSAKGPSEVISTPVFYNNRVYVAIGQDPEHGEGVGNLSCIDAGKTGDITETGKVWSFKKIHRTMSTASILDDLLYIADYSGNVFCLDANTGQEYWVHETNSHIWGSTLVADGKVFIGDEDGALTILATGKEKRVISTAYLPTPIYSTPVAANGVLYVACQTHLFAIAAQDQEKALQQSKSE